MVGARDGAAQRRSRGGEAQTPQPSSEIERLRAQVAALKVERTRLHEALRRSDERFLNTIGCCSNWTFELDARFRFTLCSDVASGVVGYRAEELIGRTPFSLMPEAVRAVVEPAWRELGSGARPLEHLESTLLHRDGSAVRVEINAVPFFSGKRRVTGYQGIIRNLSDPYRMRAELEVSEVRYRALFESTNQGVLFFEPGGTLVAANPAAVRVFRRSEQELKGATCDELTGTCVHADGRPMGREELPLARCLVDGLPVIGVTLGSIGGDGRVAAWFLADAVPIRRPGESDPFLYLVSFTDITSQVNAQHAIKERESRLRAVFDAARDVSLIVTDLDGERARIVEFSPGAERIFGYTQEEAVGKPVAMLHLPEDARRFPDAIAAMAQGEKGFGGEATLVRKSGERFNALFTTQPVFDAFGRMVATLGVSMDISHLKKAEAELRESRERLADAQRLAQLGYWEWDIAADRVLLSDELRAIFGPEHPETLDYDGLLELVHPDDRALLETRVKRAVQREKEFSIDFRVRRPDGSERHIHSEADVSFDAAGHAMRLSGMAQDITDRKKGESRLRETARRLKQQARNLEQVNAELQQFIYVMAHDLKAPLRAVSNLSTWLEEDLGLALADEHRHKVDLLRNRVQRMHGLIQALLDYSRAGRQSQVATVDCGRLVREVVASLSIPACFRVEIDAELPVFVTDRLCLAQVLTNLISNAVEHHPRKDGWVRVAASEDRKHYIFAVSDDGKGIASEYHEKIFEMFQTLEPRDKTERTGIGLALVRKLVTGAGGRVTVESTPGCGTTFRIFWPKRIKASGQFPWRSGVSSVVG